jgi:hypothetical protein
MMISKFIESGARRSSCLGVLLDPFCGHGALLAAANAAGMDCIGVELSSKRARKARNIRLVEAKNPQSKRQKMLSFRFEGERNPTEQPLGDATPREEC